MAGRTSARRRSVVDAAQTELPALVAPDKASDVGRSHTRRQAGAKAKRSGDEFEGQLDMGHDAYAAEGTAFVHFVGPRVQGPRFRLSQVKASTVDFLGPVALDGAQVHDGMGGSYFDADAGRRWWNVAFDAKTSDQASSFCLDNGRDWEKSERQAKDLLNFRRAGWLSFFLVRDTLLSVAYLVTDVETLLAGGRVTLRTLEVGRRGDVPMFTPHVPCVREASVHQLATGRPRWDWRAALPIAFPHVLEG